MTREIEAKVLEIDMKKTLAKLKTLGAKKAGDYIYNRIIYDFPGKRLDKKDAWIRLRTDGKKTTITYKKVYDKEVDGKEEEEVIVDNFASAKKILEGIGLKEQRSQESRRIMFHLNSAEIDIDIWPKIPPYLEVEAKSKKELFKTLKMLGIDINKAKTFTGRELYRHYGIALDKYKDLKLEKEKKEMKI